MPSSVALKAVAAVSGLLLAGWLLAHLAGNLTVFAGPAATDGYSAALHRAPLLLWTARVGVVAAALAHVAATTALGRRARRARPAVRPPGWVSGFIIRAGGVLLLAFVVLHLLHLTSGALHPSFLPGHPYHNVVAGLRSPPVAAAYLVACAVLGLHLAHGLASAPRSLGVAPRRRPLALLGGLVAGAFASIPLAVLAGVLR